MPGIQVMDPTTGRWVDSDSAEGRRVNAASTNLINKAVQSRYNNQMQLAEAEVDADAADYEADQNRAAGQQAFQFALSQAGGRRQPGGGIARGGYGRRGMSLNQATGGLAAANAAARRRSQMNLARARVNTSMPNPAAQTQLQRR